MEADVVESKETWYRKGDSLRFLLWERRQRQQSTESATVAAAIAYKRVSAVMSVRQQYGEHATRLTLLRSYETLRLYK